jgi:hypothetical protein
MSYLRTYVERETCFLANFEVFTAVTMRNVVFWGIEIQFVPHRIDITSPLQCPASQFYVRFEVFKAVTMKNAVSGI